MNRARTFTRNRWDRAMDHIRKSPEEQREDMITFLAHRRNPRFTEAQAREAFGKLSTADLRVAFERAIMQSNPESQNLNTR